MKHICIIVPPVNDFYFSPLRNSALGLSSIASSIDNSRYSVTFYNFPSGRRSTIKLPASLKYLKKHLFDCEKGPVSFFGSYYRFGPDTIQCVQTIISAKPDLILVGLFAFAYSDSCIELINELKAACSVPVLLGGAGVTVHPEFFLNHCNADFIFTGEADQSIDQCIEYILSSTSSFPAGLISKNKAVSQNKYICNHPESFAAVPSVVIEKKSSVKISVMLTRGCPHNCSFCVNHLVFGKTIRRGDTSLLFETVKKYKHKKIILNIEDDNIAGNSDYLINVIEMLQTAAPDLDLIFENGLDYRLVSKNTLQFLISRGLIQANFSLGTMDADANSRNFLPSRLESLLEICSFHSVPAVTYFIAGLSSDTQKKVISTVRYLYSLPTRIGYSPFYPVPGMEDFPAAGFDSPESIPLVRASSMYPWNNTLSSEELVCLFRISRIINHCRDNDLPFKDYFYKNGFISNDSQSSLLIKAADQQLFSNFKSAFSDFL